MTAALTIHVGEYTCKQCGGFEALLDERGPECGLCDDCSELWKLCDGCNTYRPSEDGDFERVGETLLDSTWLCRECADAEHAEAEREDERACGPVALSESEEWV
jgi:hypothetical protein